MSFKYCGSILGFGYGIKCPCYWEPLREHTRSVIGNYWEPQSMHVGRCMLNHIHWEQLREHTRSVIGNYWEPQRMHVGRCMFNHIHWLCEILIPKKCLSPFLARTITPFGRDGWVPSGYVITLKVRFGSYICLSPFST